MAQDQSNPEKLESMDTFVNKIASTIERSASHRPKSTLSLGQTVAYTAALNLLTLPFGRLSFGLARSRKKTFLEITDEINGALYSEFKVGIFSGETIVDENQRKKGLFKIFLDGLSEQQKLEVITMALKNKDAYQVFVKEWLWREASTQVRSS